MAISYTPVTISGKTYSATLLATEFQKIQTALDDAISRTGDTPNQMETVLDLNSHRVINTQDAVDQQDLVTLNQLENAIEDIEDDLEAMTKSQHDSDIASLSSVYAPIAHTHAAAGIGATALITGAGTNDQQLVITTELLSKYSRFHMISPSQQPGTVRLTLGQVDDEYRQLYFLVDGGNGALGSTTLLEDITGSNNVHVAKDKATKSWVADKDTSYLLTLSTYDSGVSWFITEYASCDVLIGNAWAPTVTEITNRLNTSEPQDVSDMEKDVGGGLVATFEPADYGTLLSATNGLNPGTTSQFLQTGDTPLSYIGSGVKDWYLSFYVDTSNYGGVDPTYGTEYKVQTHSSATIWQHTLVQDTSVATGVANVFHHILHLTHDSLGFLPSDAFVGIALGSAGSMGVGTGPLYNGFHVSVVPLTHDYVRKGRT